MSDIENHLVKYCVNTGSGLGRVKNRESTLARFKRLLAEPMVDTSVTFAQYMALDQDAKLEKKRYPGYWMAAHFRDGKRKLDHQKYRTMLAFDLDYVSIDQLDHIRLGLAEISQWYWIMHTTRAHCPEKPRVRIIIPVSRPMDATETHALTRLVALELADDPDEAIEIPDLVSFRFNQVMFKPSISKGQEYWMEDNPGGAILDVDEYLAQHDGWEDYTYLPYQEDERERGVVDPNRKMEHPHEKPGVIGAFCRAYDVEEAIAEFLDDIYAPGTSATETRYTYTGGSGSNGAVVYDDGLFLHSNHGTDPAEGLHNAFDLVRLHKFGHLDEKSPANTSPGNLPSFKAMSKFANEDQAVAAELFSYLRDEFDDDEEEDDDDDPDDDGPGDKPRKSESAASDLDDLLGPAPGDDDDPSDGPRDIADEFDDDHEDEEEEEKPKKKKKEKGTGWSIHLRKKANGDLEPVLNNVTLICENDSRLRDAIGYNEFTMDPVCLKQIRSSKIKLPSPPLNKIEQKIGRRWTDADDTSIKLICSANMGRAGFETDFSTQNVQDAVLAAGRQNTIHPVKDMIEEHWEEWKAAGSPTGYIDSLPQTYLGCPDTIFHRESSRLFLMGMVARIYEPGCKFDQMLIVRGLTGAGKSTFLRNLVTDAFFSEFRVDMEKIDRAVEQMRGNWLMEVAEMSKARGDNNVVKDFLSAQQDTIRLAYGRREMSFPRQSVMAATSNDDDFLSDPTSVRRFWVWEAKGDEYDQIDQDLLISNRAMIWGEAYQAYLDAREAAGTKPLHLGLKDREAIIEQRQIAERNRRHTATETIAEVIQEWLDTPYKASDVIVDEDGFAADDDDERLVYRNMVTAREAYEAVRLDPILQPYRNADARTYGKALKLVSGWTEMPRKRRHGKNAVWFFRNSDGPLWVEAPAENEADDDAEIDDLLG